MLSHAWREGDVIVWDNRAVLHRATYYDAVKHKRLMQRTTIGGDDYHDAVSSKSVAAAIARIAP